MERITTGEAKLREQQDKIDALHRKIKSYSYPMQELKIAYGQNKGKSYSDEEDRFLLVRMHHHGIDRDDCYELIKRDISDWPLFRFDWFLKSRTPDELRRRGATLLLCIMKDKDKEPDPEADYKPSAAAAKGGKATGGAKVGSRSQGGMPRCIADIAGTETTYRRPEERRGQPRHDSWIHSGSSKGRQ